MRLRGVFVSLAFAIVLVSLAAPASAQAETTTLTFHNEVMSFPAGTLPCPGLSDVTGTITWTLNGVLHLSVSAAGTVNVQFTGTGTFVLTPDNPSGRSAEGRITQWSGANLNLAGGQSTATFHATATLSDGSRFGFQGTFHFTVVGDDVVIQFLKFVCI